MSVTRKTQRTGVIYVTPRAEGGDTMSVFFTPDGRGRIWFDSVEKAQRETGINVIHFLASEPEDDA